MADPVGDGKIYYVSRGSGTAVVAAGPEFELPARNRLDGDRDAHASPAVGGSRLFLRLGRCQYCIGGR